MLLPYKGCANVQPLGVANDKVIPNGQMSSSYFKKNYHIPKDGLLNAARAWCPQTKDGFDWLQVDMGTSYHVFGIATQGKNFGAAEWTTSYWISMSLDGITFEQYKESGKVKVCRLICIYNAVNNVLRKSQLIYLRFAFEFFRFSCREILTELQLYDTN